MSELDKIFERFAPTIIEAVQREYPNGLRHVMRDDDDRPTPREVHPAFYGCFDWHSAVEMHWALAALVRDLPDGSFVSAARAVLGAHLTRNNLLTEAAYFLDNPSFERPYGWGWALALADELEAWAGEGDADAVDWAANVQPLADVIAAGFLQWLPKPHYPDRTGMHGNSAFALSRALPYARRRIESGDGRLMEAISGAAGRWFGADENYSAAFEPSGSDFLSPALTEAVLMYELLESESFDRWFQGFTGGVIPPQVLHPAEVTDPEDGQGAHLHGLNLYRVHALDRLLPVLPDPEHAAVVREAAMRHVEAGAAALQAEGWMAEHWLAAYGVLAFRGTGPAGA